MKDEYWNQEDAFLFHGTFAEYHNESKSVRTQVHLEDESYRIERIDLEAALLTQKKGTRTYVHLRPYILSPRYTLTVGLFKETGGGVIGEVLESGLAEMPIQRRECGNAQLWFYPEDHLLMIWECFLESRLREKNPVFDLGMRQLWKAVEMWACKQFPKTTCIITPWSDPIFGRGIYQEFLRSLGYTKEARTKGVYSKHITEEKTYEL